MWKLNSYPSLTKFHATCARAFLATLNFFMASTRGLYGCWTFKSKAKVASTTLSPSKINSFCCSYTSYIIYEFYSTNKYNKGHGKINKIQRAGLKTRIQKLTGRSFRYIAVWVQWVKSEQLYNKWSIEKNVC